MRNYYQSSNGSFLFHERLAIMDLECFQPIEGTAPTRQVRETFISTTKHNQHIKNTRINS
jgi:hypothetical protein